MRIPFAVWIGSPNSTPGAFRHHARGVVLHVEEGTEAGTEAWFQNRAAKASSHFGIGKNGRIAQFVDTDDKAWAQAEGNPEWYSVETEGRHDDGGMTDAQVHALARLYDALARLDGFPYQLAESPTGAGLGWHGMGGAAWGGHYDCPGGARRAQRQHVLDLIHRQEAQMPQFDPPLQITSWCIVDSPKTGGKALIAVGPDGGVFCEPANAFQGGPLDGAGHPKPYWVGHRPSRIRPASADERARGKAYVLEDAAAPTGLYEYPE